MNCFPNDTQLTINSHKPSVVIQWLYLSYWQLCEPSMWKSFRSYCRLVLYAPEGYDDFWFNLGHMFDSVKIGEKVDIDKAVEAGHLEPVHQMYKKSAMEDLRHDWGVSE